MTDRLLATTIPARFRDFALPESLARDARVVVPTVKGAWWLPYGRHAWYYINLRRPAGVEVNVSHAAIIRPGLDRLRRAAFPRGAGLLAALRGRYHYGFNCLEEVMLLTVPHTVTPLGDDRFLVNLWSWVGFLLVDCGARTVTYFTIVDEGEARVLGSAQWYDERTRDLYAMSYSLEDSFRRIAEPRRSVPLRIFRHRLGEEGSTTIWEGDGADFMHEIIVNETRRYAVACELGMYSDARDDIIPSKVLVLDLTTGKEWMIERFAVAAHAQFDPGDPDVVYFSNHNFRFEHTPLWSLLRKGTYTVKFRGPASIHRYRLTPDGPREIGVFTRPDFFRLTNMHVFMHRGRKVIAAMGFPDEIFIVDAETMEFARKIVVRAPRVSRARAVIGTMAPSPDGEKLFVRTTHSFQVVDIASGESDFTEADFFGHSCSNHCVAWSPTEMEANVQR